MTIGSNLISGMLGIILGAGVMLYNTPINVLDQPAVVVKEEVMAPIKVDIPSNTMVEPTARAVELPKPKHKIPFYPKDYCAKIKDVDKSLFRDNSILKGGWTKLQVDTLFKQCR